jgi:hypothetical protein
MMVRNDDPECPHAALPYISFNKEKLHKECFLGRMRSFVRSLQLDLFVRLM